MSGLLRYEVWEVSSLLSLGSTNTGYSYFYSPVYKIFRSLVSAPLHGS